MSKVSASAPQLLLVEDDPGVLSLVREVLEEEGYDVTPATSLPKSLTELEEHLFHFILTDLFSKSGQNYPLQSIQPLLARAAPTPVGVMTAWPVPAEAATQTDLAFLLRKPFDLDDLLRELDTKLRSRVSSHSQEQLVEQFFKALNSRDWTRLAQFCTPDMALARRPSFLEIVTQCMRCLQDYRFEDVQFFARQDGVAARYIASWQASNGRLHRAGSLYFRFQGERIAQIEGAF